MVNNAAVEIVHPMAVLEATKLGAHKMATMLFENALYTLLDQVPDIGGHLKITIQWSKNKDFIID